MGVRHDYRQIIILDLLTKLTFYKLGAGVATITTQSWKCA